MARDSRGRFTRRVRSSGGRLRAGPVEGTEVDGVVTGEPIVLGGATPEPAAAKEKGSKS
jgi:hypothetical protein